MGLVPVPCSAQLTERETAKIIQNPAPAAILYDPALACPAIARLPGAAYQILDVATLRTLRQGPLACYLRGDPNRLAYLIYTSGPCGDPQAVMHAHRAIWARRMMGSDWADFTQLTATCTLARSSGHIRWAPDCWILGAVAQRR